MRRGYLPRRPVCGRARQVVDPAARALRRASGDPQRSHQPRRLHDSARRCGRRCVPPHRPLRVPPVRCGGHLAPRDARPVERPADAQACASGARDPLRRRRARHLARRPRPQRHVARLAALDRGDPRSGPVPERDRAPGHIRGHRRHDVGPREPGPRHRRGRGHGPRARARHRRPVPGPHRHAVHRLDAAHGAGP
eukprot:Amastigsp_a179236_132.p3 type:complete len:195 gc:universal Amastigsp_a179236_132:812-1396(+)